MFQRIKGFNLDNFLDPTLAEQQKKKDQQPSKPSAAKRSPGSNAGPKQSGARTASPSKRAGSRLPVPEGGEDVIDKAPDPDDFVIGDDASDISRVQTPKPPTDKDGSGMKVENGQDTTSVKDNGKEKQKVDGNEELPEDVRKKLARLEQLTSKYQDLLRNYRSAHKRVQAVEPFEAMLRENTTLDSILDPNALVDFLSQRNEQTIMVTSEFRRVTDENHRIVKERDELKTKLDEAEKRTKEAFDEAAGLRKEREAKATAKGPASDAMSDPLGASEANRNESDFFSYDTEQQKNLGEQVEQYEVEIKGHKEYINELLTDNAGLGQQLELCQLDLSAMENKVNIKDREVLSVRTEMMDVKEKADSQVADLQERLSAQQKSQDEARRRTTEAEQAVVAAEQSLAKYKSEWENNAAASKAVQQEDKGLQNLRNLIGTLRDQITNLESVKTETEAENQEVQSENQHLQGENQDLQFAIKKLEAEGTNSAEIISSLRENVARTADMKELFVKTQEERRRDQIQMELTKKHEGVATGLRGQLKRAEKDRDAAYQLIIDCGKCEKTASDAGKASEGLSVEGSVESSRSRQGSDATLQTEASTQPTEVSAPATPSIKEEELAVGDAKKKNNKKKKSKSKKKASTEDATSVSIDELISNPAQAIQLLEKSDENKQLAMTQFIADELRKIHQARQNDEVKEESLTELRQHLEDTIEKREQIISQYSREITTLTEMNGRQDADVKAKMEEIKSLKITIAEKEAAIDSLSSKLKADGGRARQTSSGVEDFRRRVKELKIEMEAKQLTIDEKVAAIDRLDAKLKDQEGLTEEIEDLRESLLERAGDLSKIQDLKEAKESANQKNDELLKEHQVQIKTKNDEQDTLRAEMAVLLSEKLICEKQIAEAKASSSALNATTEQRRLEQDQDVEKTKKKSSELEVQVQDMAKRISSLEPELESTSNLAKERYQKLADLQKHCNDVLLPKVKKLEEENGELKTTKAESDKANAAVKKLESRERDLRSEISEYKSQVTDKNKTIAELRETVKKSQERSSALEDSYENTRKDLEKSQSTRDEAVDAREKLQVDLQRIEQEFKQSRTKLEDLERQVKKFSDEANSLRDELQIKSAQHASSQSNMDNMQDQTRELATQMKEARERNDSQEEELADAHRLLSERSREAETMRRLLGEVEGKAESRVKEMRERMDLAIEERDRAEDEASSIGRRKAREVEDLKSKLRDAERDVRRATDAREDAEKREREFKNRQAELERSAASAQEELTEVRTAMAQLRDALDESERQSRTLEKERVDIRRTLDERETRLEKLQKSSKAMAEELHGLQAANKLRQGSVPSSGRTSMDPASPRVTSPTTNGTTAPLVDTTYLKNILLQFLEQKEKKHQLQLVHVLGQLLQFNKQEEQRWQSVISAR